MEIIGLAKPKDNKKRYLIAADEDELDKMMGIAHLPHRPSRYKPGMSIDISPVYNKVKRIAENFEAIKISMQQTRVKAQEVEDDLPLLEP